MIENKIPEYIWALLIKFYINSQPFLGEIRDLKRLSLCSCWMLLVMSFTVVVRMPGIYAINATTIVPPSLTSLGFQAVVIPTDIIASSMKGKRPISIPENEVITSEDTEDYLEEDSSENYSDLDSENSSAFGIMLGARCEFTCDKRLHHVFCSPVTNKCECEKNYPVKIGSRKGCAKPKKLGDQCFYDQTCLFSDENAICMQIDHNAICQCREGFHLVSHTKPMRRTFCTQDLSTIGSDLPTLLGVTTGIAVLAGLICMVLHLFSKTKYPRTRHFADAHHGPPIMFASDTGIPLTIQSNRPSSRSSQRSTGSLDSYNGRRSSGCKGILVSQSRQGSARSAAILLISAHLNTLKEQSSSSSPNNFRSNEFMTKHIERQLEIQKKILYSEIPALRNHSSLMRKLRLNPKSDTDLTRLDNDAGLHHIIGENPLHKKLHRKFFNKSTAITTSSNSKYAASPEEQERSGVEDVFVDRNIETNLNGSSESRINNISLRTDGGYTNPLAFSADFLNGSSSTISSCSASYSNSEDEEFQRRYNADYQENFIGTMPTPASENPSIAVNNNNESMSILFFY